MDKQIRRIGVLTSGGDAPGMNALIRSVVRSASAHDISVLGIRRGYSGLINGDIIEMGARSVDGIIRKGGTMLYTARCKEMLTEEGLQKAADTCRYLGIDGLICCGGDGTFRGAQALSRKGVPCIGVPGTIDNDIGITDHTPGYGSAARYIARTTAEIGADVKSLPIHVCILEAMGRNAGWITAASALARKKHGDAPHLIYLPERPFREEEFLADVKELYDRLGGVVVVASEGLKDESGKPVVPPIFQTGRSVYYGDVGAYLAELVIKKLGIKARSEKPGLCGRASISLQSPVDREEAVLAGREALKAAMEGCTGIMIGFARREQEKYEVCPIRIPVEQVMLTERTVPASYINNRGNDVTDAFVSWCRPLTGEEIPDYIDFQEIYRERREDRE